MPEFTTLEIVLLSGLAVFLIIQLLYYWVVIAKPYRHNKSNKGEKKQFSTNQLPVSVIVYVKNEYYSLKDLLPAILTQDYPEFEVIVVNDGKDDEGEMLLTRLKLEYPNLYSTDIPDDTKNISRKKLGISLGVKAARYETLLFTEADCVPKTNRWIASMARHFQDNCSIVLGLPVKEKKKGPVSSYIAYDFLFNNIQYISRALMRHPYSASGRNLAYGKDCFVKEKGFSKFHFLQQGEDDLFVNDISTSENTFVEISPESIVNARINNWHEYKEIKKNKAITKQFYKGGSTLFWSMETFSRIAFGLLFVVVLALGILGLNYWLIGAAFFAFVVRLFSQIFVFDRLTKFLSIQRIRFSVPFFDFIQPIVNIKFYFYGKFRKKESYITRL